MCHKIKILCGHVLWAHVFVNINCVRVCAYHLLQLMNLTQCCKKELDCDTNMSKEEIFVLVLNMFYECIVKL